MDIRWVFFLSVAVVLFTFYYLEREMEREQIFWMYAVLGLVFGLISVYTVAKNISSYDYFLVFTAIFLLISILYYEEGTTPKTSKEGPIEGPEEAKPQRKTRKRKPRERKAPEAPAPVPEAPPTPPIMPPPVS